MGIIQFSSFLRNTHKNSNLNFINMSGYIVAALALVALTNVAEATLVFAPAVGTTAATWTLTSAGATLGVAGGLVALKALALGLLATNRGRRSAEEDTDAAFAVLATAEPAKCYHRLICDLAAGVITDKDNILSLFAKETSPLSPKFDYTTAAKVGKLVKNAANCEIRYSCPLNSVEIGKLYA